jgi:hypothetical protein
MIKMPKKKGIPLTIRKYKELGFKRFFKRWGEGIEGITPLQSCKTIIFSLLVVFIGLIWGIIITLLNRTFWLSLILAASCPITFIQFVGAYQKYTKLKEVEKTLKELDETENPIKYDIVKSEELKNEL